MTFSWAFQKIGWDENTDPSQDYSNSYELVGDIAKIYSINVTNTVDGGAVTCKQCPMGASISGYVILIFFWGGGVGVMRKYKKKK